MEQVMAALKEIQDTQRLQQQDGLQRAVMIAEIRTVLLGPEGQPQAGLVSKVGRIADRTTRLERAALYVFGGTGATGAALNWAAIKSGALSMLGLSS